MSETLSVTAIPKDLYVEQGATFILAFRWMNTDDDGELLGPRDLTGWSARMQIRKSQQEDPIGSATTTNGKIKLGHDPEDEEADDDPENGWVFVEFTDEDTDEFDLKTSKYDLELEDPAGRVYRFLQGKVTVSPNITQEDDDPVVES